MMRRRPPGGRGGRSSRDGSHPHPPSATRTANRSLLLVLLCLAPFAAAQSAAAASHALPRPPDDDAARGRIRSPPEADSSYQPSLASLASQLAESGNVGLDLDLDLDPRRPDVAVEIVETERTQSTPLALPSQAESSAAARASHKNLNNQNKNTPKNATAPDLSVRAPSLAPRDPVRAADLDPAASGAGNGLGLGAGRLASPHIARSLTEWDVVDFVLLATLDGDLHSIDRRSGRTLWHTQSDKPVVETEHHRAAVAPDDPSFQPVDHWTWAIEPSGDGALYLMIPGAGGAGSGGSDTAGLSDTGLTMKTILDQVPYNDPNHPVVFVGDKRSIMMTLDAATGHVESWYTSTGESSVRSAGGGERDSCLRPGDAFDDDDADECVVGGTITIGRNDYTVQVFRADGTALATLRYAEWGPNKFDDDLHQQYRASRDHRYVTSKANGDVYGFNVAPGTSDYKLAFTRALDAAAVGVYDIARPPNVPMSSSPDLVLLPQPPPPPISDEDVGLRRLSVFVNETAAGHWFALSGAAFPLIVDAPAAPCTRGGWWERHAQSTPDEHRPALAGKHTLAVPAGRRRSSVHQLGYDNNNNNNGRIPLTLPGRASEVRADGTVDADPLATAADSVIEKVKELPQAATQRVFDFFSNPVLIILVVVAVYNYRREMYLWTRRHTMQLVGLRSDESDDEEDADKGVAPVSEVPEAEVVTKVPETEVTPAEDKAPPDETNKKKAHRGRRGGAKHKKGPRAVVTGAAASPESASASGSASAPTPDPQSPTVDEVVGQAKELGNDRTNAKLEPDVLTVSYNTAPGHNDMEEVSSPILRMGSLEVNTNEQLGTGSNGTIVFAGKFDGREVAVKRMLVQFYDIYSQETKLLRESDDHPNVIRYYAQQQHANFHYIALELCRASLADIVERAHSTAAFREMAEAGERDLPDVLYQITNGLHHLHARSIVHRDLKPQNILVNMVNMAPGRARPRMLISDFGLCKKLEGGQSSFGATTAHAAGTSGWRAPELLLDDDERDHATHAQPAYPMTLVDTNTTEASASASASGALPSGQATSTRRVTKAIDIFSLGCVFFYVLTKGYHPFDVGDRYMREVNIRKATYRLDRLDVLGHYAAEAKDLVERMISAKPGHRPRTRDIMAHPFFWKPKKRLAFLCDVSDHFEKEPRDPPSAALDALEALAPDICGRDFLRALPREFVDSLGKQRKYTGTRLLDLLRALRNKRNHYEDMPASLRELIGGLPEGYLTFWTTRFPSLLIRCWRLGRDPAWDWGSTERFAEYYKPNE